MFVVDDVDSNLDVVVGAGELNVVVGAATIDTSNQVKLSKSSAQDFIGPKKVGWGD